MPRGSYVNDALLGLRILGGVLAQPSLQAAAEDQQSEQNKLLAIAQGKDPFDVPDVSPAWYSPNQGGITGGIMSGVGGLGKLMATLGGMPIRAPRPDLGEQVAALQLGQKAKENATTNSTLDELFKGDAEGRAYARIDPKAALKTKFGTGDGSPTLNRWIELANDETADPAVRAKAQRNIAEWERVNGSIAGRRAAATAPVQIGVQAANDARDAGIRERERGTKEQQGRDFIAPYLDGSVGRFERQGGRPTLLDGTPGQLRPAGFDPIADERPAPSGLVPTGGSFSAGTGTVNFGRPEKITQRTELIANAIGVDLRNPQEGDAARVLQAEQDYESNKQRRDLEIKQNYATLDEGTRKVVTGMMITQDLLRRTQTEFTPEERAQYVGLLRMPLAQVSQMARNDPKFAAFSAILGQIEVAKFELAGAALTNLESGVMERFIPTGYERGGAPEFDTKVNEYLNRAGETVKLRLLTSGPIKDIRSEVERREADANAGNDPVAAAKARLRAQGINIP